ncbi:MAG: hypothetical protein ABIG92_03190, partial [Candidatus Omnitrophota bacterium]
SVYVGPHITGGAPYTGEIYNPPPVKFDIPPVYNPPTVYFPPTPRIPPPVYIPPPPRIRY